MRVVDRLGSLQFDPLDIAGRNHDLVLLSRVAGYRREWTDALLYGADRRLYEAYNKGLSLLPVAELPWHRLRWDRSGRRHATETFVAQAALVAELTEKIRIEGELSSIDLPPGEIIEWSWRPTNAVRAVLEALAFSGRLGIARRQGNRRYYDFLERLFPAELLERRVDQREQARHHLLSRYRAHGLLGRTGPAELWLGVTDARSKGRGDPTRAELLRDLIETDVLAPVEIEGVRGERFVLTGELPMLAAAIAETGIASRSASAGSAGLAGWRPIDGNSAGVAFLAPLDPFAWDRDLLRTLFDFDYLWEVYVPEAKREWGYYVLPILYGERLIGRIEPRIDRRAGTLEIRGLWLEPGFDAFAQSGFMAAFADALDAHRRFGDVRRVSFAAWTPRRPGERRQIAEARRLVAEARRLVAAMPAPAETRPAATRPVAAKRPRTTGIATKPGPAARPPRPVGR